MKVNVISFETNKAAGDIVLNEDVFGLAVRPELLQMAVRWRRAKDQAGTHKTKEIGDVSGTTAKPWKQKGTGHARQGSRRSPQFRGGAVIFGPVVRSHAFNLPKKVRKLALKMALSDKLAKGQLAVVDNVAVSTPKTSEVAKKFAQLGWGSVLVIDGNNVNEPFKKAVSNLKQVDVLPQIGANVYDILRHERLILTKEAVKALEERLNG